MNKHRFLAFVTALLLWVLLVSCNGKKPTPPDDQSPTSPVLVGPANNGSDVGLQEALVWQCSDPNGDPLTYALYFGETNPPPLLVDKLTDTSYTVRIAEPGKTYYWKVVASDPDGNSSGSRVMTFVTTRSFQYPLAVGNRWGYDLLIVYDSLDGAFVDTMAVGEVTVVIETDTLLFDSLPVSILYEQRRDSYSTFESHTFSNNTTGGMFTYAYTNNSSVSPGKSTDMYTYTLNGQDYASTAELFLAIGTLGQHVARSADALFIEDPPVKVFAYPFEVGTRWTYRTEGSPWRIDRRVVAYEQLDIPAGKFSAFKIEWLFDFNNDGVWENIVSSTDWVAFQGLVKRETTAFDVVIRDYEQDSLGVMDFHENYTLRDFGGN